MSARPVLHAIPKFLTLPREIRDLIWYFALMAPVRAALSDDSTHLRQEILENEVIVQENVSDMPEQTYREEFWGCKPMSALLAVNRQTHDEVEQVLYSRFIFHFYYYQYQSKESRLVVDNFFDTVSPKAQSLVQAVAVEACAGTLELFRDVPESKEASIYTALKRRAPGLTTLEIRPPNEDDSLYGTEYHTDDQLERKSDQILQSALPLKDVKTIRVITQAMRCDRGRVACDLEELPAFKHAKKRVEEGRWPEPLISPTTSEKYRRRWGKESNSTSSRASSEHMDVEVVQNQSSPPSS